VVHKISLLPSGSLSSADLAAIPAVSTDTVGSGAEAMTSTVKRTLWDHLGRPNLKALVLGCVGGATLVIGGLGAGGVLVHDPILGNSPLSAWRFGHGYDLAVVITYLGLLLEVWAWVLLGRDVISRRITGRGVLSSALPWTLPMLLSPPLFTRDPYAYIAYGLLALRGFNPYSASPSMLSGPVPDNVHQFWIDTPAVYGPLFISIAKAVVSITGENMIAGVILMRLVLTIGLIPLIVSLRGLCRHHGGSVPAAYWLIISNPVMVILMIGGAHNDLLVVGLLSLGCLLVLNCRHVLGIAIVTLAMAVKATAGLALPFLVLVWAGRLNGRWRTPIVIASVAGLAVFAAVFAACSVVAGVGLGWLLALSAPSRIVDWLSLPTGVGQVAFSMAHALFSGVSSESIFIFLGRSAGALTFIYIAVKQWLAARAGGSDAVRRASIVLLLAALLAPATLPWYFSWGMVLLATTTWTVRRMQVAVFASLFLFSGSFPDGELALYDFGYVILVIAGGVVAAISVGREITIGRGYDMANP
jgi:alpha-1,6-mannosyltransferase